MMALLQQIIRPIAMRTGVLIVGLYLSLGCVLNAQAQEPVAARYAALDVIKAAQSCASLTQVELITIGGAGSKITAAKESNGKGGAVCNVSGTFAPAINFSLQLPLQSWSQRYLQIGCGGLCGNISRNVGAADGCVPLNAGGFVIGATDMGHQDQDGSFGDDSQKRADFAYRAQHLTALAAKKLIQVFYGRPQAYAYFSGCSDGGREALMEAQRYPDDFDGIIAGAGALNFQTQNAVFHAWQARANTDAEGQPILLAARLPLLHKAVLAACDGLDGLTDGLISNPLACHFDPATLQCPAKAKSTASCLSAAEVAVVRKLYDGPRDPDSGKRLTAGGPQFGSELAWAGVYVPRSATQPGMSAMIALQVLQHLAFEPRVPAGFTLADMQFDQATFDKLRLRHRLFDATNPDLSPFEAAGGKLILWHGWADPHISPINTIAYYSAVQRQMGPRAANFTRLYLFPGMYHCSGGEGPSQVDLLTPMMNWVEARVAPDVVVAAQPEQVAGSDFGAPMHGRPGPASEHGSAGKQGDGGPSPGAMGAGGPPPQAMGAGPGTGKPAKIVRTRPVYPWPYIAAYDGQGDPAKASSFVRGTAISFDMPDWAGADFFIPYVPLMH